MATKAGVKLARHCKRDPDRDKWIEEHPFVFAEDGAARYIGVSPDTLRKWREKREGPLYFKAGARLVRYRKRDLDTWINERVRLPSPTVALEA